MTTLLIDGDLLLYRSAAATESEVQWDDDNWILHSNLTESKDLFTTSLDGITNALGTKSLIMCLSDSANFRKDLTPTYKSKRKDTRKPIVFKAMLEWIKETYDPIIKPRLEADDVLGILATHPDYAGKCIIVSEDKDMQTLPCALYRQGELKTISEADADYFWAFQTLTGDSTDGYNGCPGVGPKKAESILTSPPYWPKIVNAYRKAGMTEEDALLNARLARILRYSDWDIKKQEVKLWTPTNDTTANTSTTESQVSP